MTADGDRNIGVVDETTWFFRTFVRRRVTWGFVLAALFLVTAAPTRASVLFGLLVALCGEALRTWASGLLVKNRELATQGPFRLTRNPLYVGSFVAGTGIALMGNRPWFLVAFLLFFIPVYHALVRKEEAGLLAAHGDRFRAYCAEVPRFVPALRAWPPDPGRFDGARMWLVHKEWKAWAALYLVTVYLLLRAG